MDAGVGRVVEPVLPLGAQVAQVSEGAPLQEVVFEIEHQALDFTLRARVTHAVRLRRDAVM